MSAAGTIAKLEAILARVRTRTGEARPVRHVAAAEAAPVPVATDLTEEESDQPTLPPPPVAAVQPARVPSAVPMPASVRPRTLELSEDIDMDEPVGATEQAAHEPEPVPAIADALSSQERLVAVEPAATSSDVPEPARLSPEPRPPSRPPERVAQAEAPEVAADEEVEEPPVSSRRPLAPQPEERLAEMAFGADEPRPALHTPPPESGRLPAAPEVEFGDEDTGVHAAAPPASAVLTSETTRADLTGGDRVAAVQGGIRAFHPTSFAELLDASLGL